MKDWNKVKLESICITSFWIMPQTPPYIEKGIPYITSKNIYDGRIHFDKFEYISEEDYKKISSNRPILKGDALISMIGTIGEIGFVNEYDLPFYGQNMYLLRLNNRVVDSYFFYYYFTSTNVRNRFQTKKNRSTQGYLKKEHLTDLEIPLPSLIEQKKISEIFTNINKIKNNYKKLLEKQDLLIKSRFIEMFGDPVTNPKNWKVRKLSELAEYWNGLTYKPENVNENGTIVLRSSNIQDSTLDFDDIVRVDCEIKEKYFVKDNDILMCSRNGSAKLVGKVALIKDLTEKTSFGAFMMIIRSNYNHYLFTYFQTEAFRRQIKTGATTTVNQITNNMLNQISVPLPPIELQNDFAAFVQQIDKSKFEINFEEKAA